MPCGPSSLASERVKFAAIDLDLGQDRGGPGGCGGGGRSGGEIRGGRGAEERDGGVVGVHVESQLLGVQDHGLLADHARLAHLAANFNHLRAVAGAICLCLGNLKLPRQQVDHPAQLLAPRAEQALAHQRHHLRRADRQIDFDLSLILNTPVVSLPVSSVRPAKRRALRRAEKPRIVTASCNNCMDQRRPSSRPSTMPRPAAMPSACSGFCRA